MAVVRERCLAYRVFYRRAILDACGAVYPAWHCLI